MSHWETTIGGFSSFDRKGVPEFVRMRRATQDASTIDEWCAAMRKGNNGGYANAWLLGDVNTKEIARLELGLKFIGFERTKDGFYIGSNIAEDLRILRLETDFRDKFAKEHLELSALEVIYRLGMAHPKGLASAQVTNRKEVYATAS